jgi:hypothetical protein
MADFKTHITVSTAIGVAYGGVAYTCFQPYFNFEYPATTCLLAGTLCSVSGMLPDLDSDSGVPLRESLTFASACIPMLLLDRFQHQWMLPPEQIAMAGAAVYGAVRFGLGTLLKKYTVHRGMFHSIPAAIIAGEIAFLLCSHGNPYVRGYKAAAVVIGFLSHLILDEIWSVKVTGGRVGLKSSSGTAMKLWGSSMWANISTYAKLALLTVLVLKDPLWANVAPELHQIATRIDDRANTQGALGAISNKATDLAARAGIPTGSGAAIGAGTNGATTNGTTTNNTGGPRGVAPPPLERPAPTQQASGGGVYVPRGTVVPPGITAPQLPRGAAPTIPTGYTQPGYGAPGYATPGYAAPAYNTPGYGAPNPNYGGPGYAVPPNSPPPNYQQPSYPPPNYQQPVPGYSIPMGVGPGQGRPRY